MAMQRGRTVTSRWLRTAFGIERRPVSSELPLFLCPAVRALSLASPASLSSTAVPRCCYRQRRSLHVQDTASSSQDVSSTLHPPLLRPETDRPALRSLPSQCSGCGALSQTKFPEQAGYYDLERKAVKSYIGLLPGREEANAQDEDKVFEDALRAVDPATLQQLDLPQTVPAASTASKKKPIADHPPLCDRCHRLVHHRAGTPIHHPSIDSIRETIEESPHKYNHVYHVLDAADFPMSVLPHIHSLLHLMPLRTKNRRSRDGRYFQGRKTEMSFIITRSDLLAPRKEQVDALMPYLTETLRDALGRTARSVRLGNVRCVSAKRSWWTKELKEEIWQRGGAGWMVGRVNVGKSQLFESVFPKGRMDWEAPKRQIEVEMFAREQHDPVAAAASENQQAEPFLSSPSAGEGDLDEFSLLPPVQAETNYPQMPVVSALPGTTASPIRVPFGNGRGELIDLPGLNRSDLELFVKEEHRPSLVMKARVVPEQQVIKPGRSLLLGGMIRITPRTPDLIFLSYNFTPLREHRTATEKAIGIQEQTSEIKVENISLPGTGAKTRHAGSFELSSDVTRARAGPITRKDAANLKIDRLPYRVLAIDILIEGCGWVEIAAQVRTKDLYAPRAPSPVQKTGDGLLQSLDFTKPAGQEAEGGGWGEEQQPETEPERDPAEPNWPVIDVYSPEGRFIGSRAPMNAWLLNKPKNKGIQGARKKPSMKGAKKREKAARRAEMAGGGPSE